MTDYTGIASFFFADAHFVYNSLTVNDLGSRAAPRRKSLILNNLGNAREQKNIVASKKHFITIFHHKKTPSVFGGGRFIVTFLVYFNRLNQRRGKQELRRLFDRLVFPRW